VVGWSAGSGLGFGLDVERGGSAGASPSHNSPSQHSPSRTCQAQSIAHRHNRQQPTTLCRPRKEQPTTNNKQPTNKQPGQEHDLRILRAGDCNFSGVCGFHTGTQFLAGSEGEVSGGLFCGARSDSVVCEWSGLRRGLPVGGILSGHLRDDCLLRIRRIFVFDWISGGLDCGLVRGGGTHEAAGEVHICGCPGWLGWCLWAPW